LESASISDEFFIVKGSFVIHKYEDLPNVFDKDR